MSQYLSEVTAVSSKGQVVLPKSIRESLSLTPGAKLMVFSDGENILLKPIRKPDLNEFRVLMDGAAQWAADAGMTTDDINEAIAEVRKARRKSK